MEVLEFALILELFIEIYTKHYEIYMKKYDNGSIKKRLIDLGELIGKQLKEIVKLEETMN